MTATAPLVVVLVVCVAGLLVGTAIAGESIAETAFGGLEAPTNALEVVTFALDLLLGLGQVAVAILTADFGWPLEIRFFFATICDTIIVVSIVGLFS